MLHDAHITSKNADRVILTHLSVHTDHRKADQRAEKAKGACTCARCLGRASERRVRVCARALSLPACCHRGTAGAAAAAAVAAAATAVAIAAAVPTTPAVAAAAQWPPPPW